MRRRKPTPTHLRLLRGNPGRRPLPENEFEPDVAIPEKPDWLDAEASAEWDHIAPILHHQGLLTHLDRAILVKYCQRWGDEKLHRVTLTQGFWLARTPVTQGQFARFVESGSHEGDDQWKQSGGERHPVAYVSWHDAWAFFRWLSDSAGENIRLPIEAEWEHAARAGTTSARYAEPLDESGGTTATAKAIHIRWGRNRRTLGISMTCWEMLKSG